MATRLWGARAALDQLVQRRPLSRRVGASKLLDRRVVRTGAREGGELAVGCVTLDGLGGRVEELAGGLIDRDHGLRLGADDVHAVLGLRVGTREAPAGDDELGRGLCRSLRPRAGEAAEPAARARGEIDRNRRVLARPGHRATRKQRDGRHAGAPLHARKRHHRAWG